MKQAMRWPSAILLVTALAACQRREAATPSAPETAVARAADAAGSPADALAEAPTTSALVHVPQASLKALGDPQFRRFRMMMVRDQIGTDAGDGRQPIRDPRVLEAMRMTPRHEFVPSSIRRYAYIDQPLEIGFNQTISQPYIVAIMSALLKLTPESKVLEIGTGSGYQAAVLAHITPHVYTVEIVKALAEQAAQTLREQGYTEVNTRRADGYFGWNEHAPYDAIIVTCAAGHLPPPLWEQLKPGGRIVIPIGGPLEVQRLVVVSKTAEGKRESATVMPVRFVPLVREEDKSEKP